MAKQNTAEKINRYMNLESKANVALAATKIKLDKIRGSVAKIRSKPTYGQRDLEEDRDERVNHLQYRGRKLLAKKESIEDRLKEYDKKIVALNLEYKEQAGSSIDIT